MLFKKSFSSEVYNGVQAGNGTISFQNVRMNVYMYYLDGVLIDTGAKSIQKESLPFFRNLNIDQVVITHYHEDHTGCASFLERDLGLPVFMNKMMIDYCRKKAAYPLYRQLYWGKRKSFQAAPLGKTFTSAHGKWDVLETPGHSKDHLSFLNRETGQLFTGDLYCQERTKVVLREESIPTIINSLQHVLTFEFDDVFCCHSGYLKDGRHALERKLHYLLDLQQKVLNMYGEGQTPDQINNVLFPKKYSITRFSSGEWDSIHIVNSILQEQ